MQGHSSQKEPRSRAFLPLVALALAVLVAAALLWLLRTPAKPTASAARAAAGAGGSYRNRAILRSGPRPSPDPIGHLAIKGNVYGGNGEILAGAVVVASTFDRAGNIPSPAGATKSDPGGHFEIPLPEGTYQVNATFAGYGPSAITAMSGDTVSIVLPKSGVLQGHVRDAQGKPVRRFTIDLVSVVPGDAPAPPPVWSKAFDSPDGAYKADQLPAWPVMVRASADSYAPAFSQPVGAHAGETREIDLTLGDGCTLTGTVVDKKGNPLGGVLVNAEERVSAGSAADPALQASTQAQSNDDGSFTLEHVPNGMLLVRGYDGDYAVSTQSVNAKDCAKLQPVKITMSTGGSVQGVARRPDGAPIPGARLSIADRSLGFVNVAAGPDGHYRFDSIPAGAARIELEHQGQRAMKYVGIKDGETITQDIMIIGGGDGELAGHVTAGKHPIAGARLLVASNHGDQGIAMYFPVTGEDGSFRVPKIAEGNYLVSVMSTTEGRGLVVRAGETTNVELDAGFVMPNNNDGPRPRSQRAASMGAAEAPPTPAPAPPPAPPPTPTP